MNNRIIIALALTMALTLCACGASDPGSGSDTVTADVDNEQREEDVDALDGEEQEAEEIEADTGETSSIESSYAETETVFEDAPNSKKADFESTVLVDNDECAITIKDIDPEGEWGYTLYFLLENKSSENNYAFTVEDAYVNGVLTDSLISFSVAAGKKANEEMVFESGSLDKAGIRDFTDIELSFKVYKDDDWEEHPVLKETFHVYPYGEEKAENYVRVPADTDTVLVDDDKISIIVTGYTEDELYGYGVELYLVNKTDKRVSFGVEDTSVNGFMAEPLFVVDGIVTASFFTTEFAGNKCSFPTLYWDYETLQKNDIKTVEEIEVNFKVYEVDETDSDGETYLEKVFTLKP